MDALTPRQFRDRMQDIGIIHAMMEGQGKGRVRRDKARHVAVLAKAGKRPPREWGK